ncbi:AAA domain protein [Leptospira ryugenii]|uniref:AAA domain protein n=1 Tax=Leptospira ryugenii TaxID=1917863 RepID=A0A2P2E463_9LEPT|nr:AAA family ATPase [Leptospira ryugenii]GBF51663.1 AAA domain protein [Leptospira ryugenii]
MEKTLLLLRGLPGSGKSTFVELLKSLSPVVAFSLDEYFLNEEGIYHFNYRENHKAYKQCYTNVHQAMKDSISFLIVDQTFVSFREIKPYLDLALEFSYKTFVLTVENRHDGENQHGISDTQLVKMAESYKVKLLPKRLEGFSEREYPPL